MQKHRHAALLIVLALILAACGDTSTNKGTATTGTGASGAGSPAAQSTGAAGNAGKVDKIGLVLSGPVGVNPFLKAIKDGFEKAGNEMGAKTTVVESRDVPAIEGNLRRLVQEGNKLVACNSFECVDHLKKVAGEIPNQRFLIVDAVVDAPNVSSAVFREHESAFLAGAEAAMVSKSKKVGFVGAMDIPLLHRWSDGYKEGVASIDPNVNVQIAWSGSFEDVAKAKELATIQANQGADIIFPPAAAGIFGVFEAAKSKGFKAIGVDVDYREQFPEIVIDSQLKNTDVVTYESVQAFANGKLQPGTKSYGLKENGVALASISKPNQISDKALGPDVIKRLKEIQEKIISGEIKIKDPLAQQ